MKIIGESKTRVNGGKALKRAKDAIFSRGDFLENSI